MLTNTGAFTIMKTTKQQNNKRTENKRFQGTVDNQFTSNKIQAKEVRTAKDLNFVSFIT